MGYSKLYSIMEYPSGWRGTKEYHVHFDGNHIVFKSKSQADLECQLLENRGFRKVTPTNPSEG